MTVTVVYKSPFPWTVSTCLLWDETRAIRSSALQTPALLCSVFLPKPPTTQQSNAAPCWTIWFVFRQSTDKELLMLIKDDVSEIYPSNAKHWFSVGWITQMSFAKWSQCGHFLHHLEDFCFTVWFFFFFKIFLNLLFPFELFKMPTYSTCSVWMGSVWIERKVVTCWQNNRFVLSS